jgi:hypothetical protein
MTRAALTGAEVAGNLRRHAASAADGLAQQPAKKRAASSAASGARWAMLNAFVDLVAPHLTATEQAIWLHLYRHCRDGTAKATTRRLAEHVNVDPKTATRALRWLTDCRLVWTVHLARFNGDASEYGLQASPGLCRQKCEELNATRSARRPSPRRPTTRRRHAAKGEQ